MRETCRLLPTAALASPTALVDGSTGTWKAPTPATDAAANEANTHEDTISALILPPRCTKERKQGQEAELQKNGAPSMKFMRPKQNHNRVPQNGYAARRPLAGDRSFSLPWHVRTLAASPPALVQRDTRHSCVRGFVPVQS